MPTNDRIADKVIEQLDHRDVSLESVDVLATSDLDITMDPEDLER